MAGNEDKFAVLNRIFGSDLTESVIHTTLQETNNEFDPAVDKLLSLPSNKARAPVAPAPVPLDGQAREKIQTLQTMFSDLTQSVITTVYETNKRDVDGTVDTLLNLTSNDVASGARREAEIARQEQEIKAYEEYKKLQQKLQEDERRYSEAAQRAKEEEDRRRKEEEGRKKAEEARKVEQDKALREQERLLQEFQRKKTEDDKIKGEEMARRKEEERKEREREQERARLDSLLANQKAAAEKAAKDAEAKAAAAALVKAKAAEMKALEEMRALEKVQLEQERQMKLVAEERKKLEELKSAEERAMKKRFEEEKAAIQVQRNLADTERKLLEERMRHDKAKDEEERQKRLVEERHFREEQERARKTWDEEMKRLERERAQEESRRQKQVREEEEARNRKEADMRQLLEFERLKLDEQRRKVEEDRRKAEEKLMALEMAALRREEQERMAAEERRAQEIEEHRRKEEEEKEIVRAEEARKNEEEAKKKAAEENFAASAVMVTEVPTVKLSASVEGNTISGTWELVAGLLSPQAWVGVFPRRSINSPAGYLYVSGTQGDFQFKGLTPGHYEVRFFAFKPVTTRITETAALPVGPNVNNFTVQLMGSQLMLEYQLDPPSNPSSWDWVGIYPKDTRRNKEYINSIYGQPSGAVTAPLPRAPGNYQARLFAAGSKYNEQAVVDFVVVDNDRIEAPQSVASGAPITATWMMLTQEPSSSDWIGLFTIGEQNNNKYVSSAYTSGTSAGDVNVPFPKEDVSGPFELRLFSSKLGKYTTFKTSGPIYVTQN